MRVMAISESNMCVMNVMIYDLVIHEGAVEESAKAENNEIWDNVVSYVRSGAGGSVGVRSLGRHRPVIAPP